MSDSPHTSVTVDEETPLKTVPGSGDPQNGAATAVAHRASRFRDKHHRWLAICSIICGISCIGIKALINSVKAEWEPNEQASQRFSRRARKFGIISIVTWLSILALAPPLMALGSYLVTLQD
ncbi:transmembrane protein 265-like [Dunckerocampus dactyliophorus]|uniref:transmembrane protein 265-like n=1 Tax=Dunckerocampus dactyliophorus TaxID=161453 RepID=UPI002406D625|nr:transmembrane protein 265-like [Dunckerocampus dactyliophorus]